MSRPSPEIVDKIIDKMIEYMKTGQYARDFIARLKQQEELKQILVTLPDERFYHA